jgi:hypothetical protein
MGMPIYPPCLANTMAGSEMGAGSGLPHRNGLQIWQVATSRFLPPSHKGYNPSVNCSHPTSRGPAVKVLPVAAIAALTCWSAADCAEPGRGALGVVVLRSWDEAEARTAAEIILEKKHLPNPKTHGVFVTEVLPQMGGGILEKHDIIIRLKDLKIDSDARWEKAQNELVAGKPVKIAIKRIGKAKDGSREWHTSIVDITPHRATSQVLAEAGRWLARAGAQGVRERHLSDLRDYVAAFPDPTAQPRYEGPLPVFPDSPKKVGGIDVKAKTEIIGDMILACPEVDVPLSEIAPWVPNVTNKTLRDFIPQDSVVVPNEIRAIYDFTVRRSGKPVNGVAWNLTQADRFLMNEAEQKYPSAFPHLMSILQMMFYLGPQQPETLQHEWDQRQRNFFTAEDVETKTVEVPVNGGGKTLYWKQDEKIWQRFAAANLDANDIRELRAKHPANIAQKQREAEEARQRKAEELVRRGAKWYRATCRNCGDKWGCYGVMGEDPVESTFLRDVVIGEDRYFGGGCSTENRSCELLWTLAPGPPP